MKQKQWKPDRRRKIHRDAKKAGLTITYDALDIPPEPKGQRVSREMWLAGMEAKNRRDDTKLIDFFGGDLGNSGC